MTRFNPRLSYAGWPLDIYQLDDASGDKLLCIVDPDQTTGARPFGYVLAREGDAYRIERAVPSVDVDSLAPKLKRFAPLAESFSEGGGDAERLLLAHAALAVYSEIEYSGVRPPEAGRGKSIRY